MNFIRFRSFRLVLAVCLFSIAAIGSHSFNLTAASADRYMSDVTAIELFQPSSDRSQSNFSDAPGKFRFITPIAANPHDPRADFDDGLLTYLTVSVCRVVSDGCAPVRSFNSQGPMAERLRVEAKPGEGEYFAVNWDTSRAGLGNTATYRITVDAAGIVLGFVNLAPAQYRQFGRTWPIKFIVEKDAELRIRVLRAAGASLWEVADILRSELGICGDELSQALLSTYPNATVEEVEMVVNGVCQEVIIPVTTKIADNATRGALSFYDSATGRMLFANETSLLKNLNINDVLVSKPSAAAPYGFLRKVTSVRKDRGMYIVDTVQATLTEAISKGTLDATGELVPNDGTQPPLSSPVAAPGFKDESSPSPNIIIDEGDVFNFHRDIDVTINFDGSEDGVEGTGTVRVTGFVYFNAGYNVGIGIRPCLAIPPACPDRFEAWAGLEQKSRLRVTGNFDGEIHKEKIIHPIPMKPIWFFIGPVPVVLVPEINVKLGVDGEAHVDFVFEGEAKSKFKAGAKWLNPDYGGNGWNNISEYVPLDKKIHAANINAKLRVEGYAKVDASIKLYGVAGPGIDGSVGILVDADTNRKPFWFMEGHVTTNVRFEASIADIVELANYSTPILNEFIRIAESPNSPPVFSNVRDGAIQARVNRSVFIGPDDGLAGKNYDIVDPEGDNPVLTFSASPDGVISGQRVTFASPGLKTVKVTARDSEGLTSELFLGIDVRNSPPEVTITPASGETQATVQYWLSATAYDPEEGTLRCSRLTWSATGAHTKTVLNNNRSCGAVFKFSNPGPHTVTVSATDSLGATMSKDHHVTVYEPPDTPLPEIEPNSFSVQAISRIRRRGDTPFQLGCLPGQLCEVENGDLIFNGFGGDFVPPLIMRLNASDPSGGPVTVQWQCQTGENFAPITDNGDGSFSCNPIYLANTPIRVYAFIFTPPPLGTELPGPAVKSEERTYFMLQAPN